MSNEDKIKELDSYRLAAFLNNFQPCMYCTYQSYMCPKSGHDCLVGIREWLQAESGE